MRSEDEWFCQKRSTGRVVRNADTVREEKIAILEKTLACVDSDKPILAARRVLVKAVERHWTKLNGPKNTAKHIEAMQTWINRETKRVEAEIEKVAEVQESSRVRKETPRVPHEEIKKLRPSATELATKVGILGLEVKGLIESSKERLAEALATFISVETARTLVCIGELAPFKEVHEVALTKLRQKKCM